MIFGGAEIMSVPWEVVIKSYRDKLGEKSFGTLGEYADDFLAYIRTSKSFFSEEAQRGHLAINGLAYFQIIRDEVLELLQKKIEREAKVTQRQVKLTATKVVNDHFDIWRKGLAATSEAQEREILKKHADVLVQVRERVFEKLPISKATQTKLSQLGVWLCTRRPRGMESPFNSGIVVAGYGTNEHFPHLRSYTIYGVVEGVLNHAKVQDVAIDFSERALIIPFAQKEAVQTFMEGIDPYYAEAVNRDLTTVFGLLPSIVVDTLKNLTAEEKRKLKTDLRKKALRLLSEYQRDLDDYRHEHYVKPVVGVAASLPKDELAAMAEALVNLTMFKRRITPTAETVGGPIDVAVISRGDGFVWIKRKHYFDPELNHHFLANYFRKAGAHATS